MRNNHDKRSLGLIRSLIESFNRSSIVQSASFTKNFYDLLDIFLGNSPDIARGVGLAAIQSELMKALKYNFFDIDAKSVVPDDIRALDMHLQDWFKNNTPSRRVFIPCDITPYPMEQFRVGPANFSFLDDLQHNGFLPSSLDSCATRMWHDMISVLAEGQAKWIVCVSVEGCDSSKADEIGKIAATLAIAALQISFPRYWGTSRMSILEERRGSSWRCIISEVAEQYYIFRSKSLIGISSGPDTINDGFKDSNPVIEAAGFILNSFSSGNYRLPKLEQAWCDAAYWFHEAIGETIDTIAITKFETALEVLLCSESTRGSQSRLEKILLIFYHLGPDAPIRDGSPITAKNYAKKIISNRSRVLHGTLSTLNPQLNLNREGIDQFATHIMQRFTTDLNIYTNISGAEDSLDAFIKWIETCDKSQK